MDAEEQQESAVSRLRRGAMRIVGVAIRTREGKVYSLPSPNRHHHLVRMIFEETGKPLYGETQGFLTNCGRFMNRSQARVVARKSGQLKGDLIGSVLTSEDLW